MQQEFSLFFVIQMDLSKHTLIACMHEADDAYSIWSTLFVLLAGPIFTLALSTLILSVFYISLDLSTIYFTHFDG